MRVSQAQERFNEAEEEESRVFAQFGNKSNRLEDEAFILDAYINDEFPNEQSLSYLHEKIEEMTAILGEVNSEIGVQVRTLAWSNLIPRFEKQMRAFEEELIPRVREKERQDGEFKRDVEYIFANIRELDENYKNLSDCVNLLQSVSVSGLVRKEIRRLMDSRSYSELVPLLILGYDLSAFLRDESEFSKAMIEIREQVDQDKVRKEIHSGLLEMERLLSSLRQQITEDFLALIDPYILFLGGVDSQENANVQTTPLQHLEAPEKFRDQMKSCCYCVEILGDDFRAEIVDTFTSKLLEPYCRLFSYSQTENFFGSHQSKDKLVVALSAAGVEFIERRFGWYRRCLKEYEQQFGEVFLTKWELPTVLTEKFFAYTRKDLLQSLGDVGHLLDHEVILEYSLKCHQFEEYVVSRFAQIYDQQLLFWDLEKERLQEVLDGTIGDKRIRDFCGRNFQSSSGRSLNSSQAKTDSLESSRDKTKREQLEFAFSSHDGVVKYPQTRELLTECFVPYLTSFLDSEKESVLRKVAKELAPSEEMTENIQIRRETDVLGMYETIPLIWTSSKALSQLINTVFQRVEHLLGYDDIYIQFSTLVLQIVQTYIDQKITSCNIQRALDKITNNIYSGSSSFENIVEAVVTTVSTQTSKVAASTGGILFTSTSNDHMNSELKYNARKLAATLGSIDYLEWIHARMEAMIKGGRISGVSELGETGKAVGGGDLMPRGQNVMFSNYMWVSKRKILGCVVKELSRQATQSMSEWYTKKTQKLNEEIMARFVSESELPKLVNSFTEGTLSLVQVLGESLVKPYVQYSQHMPIIYRYSIASQVMLRSLSENWRFVVSLKGPLHCGTLEVVANEQRKLSSLFTELPSYFPVVYVPRAYIESVNILVSKSFVFLRIAQERATAQAASGRPQLDQTFLRNFTTLLCKSPETGRPSGGGAELSALDIDLALRLGSNDTGNHQNQYQQ